MLTRSANNTDKWALANLSSPPVLSPPDGLKRQNSQVFDSNSGRLDCLKRSNLTHFFALRTLKWWSTRKLPPLQAQIAGSDVFICLVGARSDSRALHVIADVERFCRVKPCVEQVNAIDTHEGLRSPQTGEDRLIKE